MTDGQIAEVSDHIIPEHGDKVVNCDGLEIWPGLIDMHLHVADLYEVSTGTPYCAVEDGVTTALSPGAGNTFMTPALLGAEVDRGLPINVGAYLGAANVLATRLTDQELIDMFRGELPEQVMKEKMTRNAFTNMTAKYCIGIKEHMGHFILPDEWIERIYHITAEAGLLLMSHTQDPKHTAHMVELSKGRPLHLGHANAAGCGTHATDHRSLQAAQCDRRICDNYAEKRIGQSGRSTDDSIIQTGGSGCIGRWNSEYACFRW